MIQYRTRGTDPRGSVVFVEQYATGRKGTIGGHTYGSVRSTGGRNPYRGNAERTGCGVCSALGGSYLNRLLYTVSILANRSVYLCYIICNRKHVSSGS